MKNLKKLSRKELKSLKAGNGISYDLSEDTGDSCADMCTPNGGGGGDDGCRQYGLTCGMFQCSTKALGFRCM
ncbi:hypothetical protein NAL32_11490 [Chryseobacterium sp. Ch-15]|uniref:Uncharacterized protein n=1 Tax=Chryseobacterium muglaense TaxID=2893752 RepID=A0A9Q3YQ66_9FLAO|nr:hypothetical protein [Chryseobacterium muglaense]MBD3905070.1 hypothetical protein [Chryseobacterium muglaense]MCC9033489.1 hypothetical protein [Chryseobacterium muglaense]MCM2555008.1 hypothetical protein [Chryseobacterium muglaense]